MVSSESLELGGVLTSGTMFSFISGLNPSWPSFQGMVTLFSHITKLGWFDSDEDEFLFRAVITDQTRLLQGGEILILLFNNLLISG